MRSLYCWLWSVLVIPGGTCAAHEIEGTWRFEKEVSTRADGSVVAVPGPDYDGLLIYTRDGFVSANIMPRGRRWAPATATLVEFRASSAEGASTAYAGRYEIDAATHRITHIPAVSLDPGDTGKRLVREFKVTGDKLLLSGEWEYQGEKLTFTVHWIRAAAPLKN